MISVSTASSLDPKLQTHFTTADNLTATRWQEIITTKAWSPIVWTGGVRRRPAFARCDYVALDFDGGTTIAEVTEFLDRARVGYIIGTTKSHQKTKTTPGGKHTPACDRFRCVMRASTTCTNRQVYEHNMAMLARFFDADISCKDAARFYFPCREVVAFRPGKSVDWKTTPPDEDYEPEEVKFARRRAKLREQYSRWALPPWVQDIVTGRSEIPPGERHKTAYSLGATLQVLGLSIEEIHRTLLTTRLADIGERELWRAVANGWTKSEEQG